MLSRFTLIQPAPIIFLFEGCHTYLFLRFVITDLTCSLPEGVSGPLA
jgi:hypothetical protein